MVVLEAMMRRTKWFILGTLAAIVVIAGVLAAPQFLPEKADKASEAAPDATALLATGSFRGQAGHHVSGTVKLIEAEGAYYLRFENYSQTQGPDVFVYLTPSSTPDEGNEIAAGVRIRIDGGPDGGEIAKEGDFNQKLPDGVDPTMYNGVGIWCDQFKVPFGYASLR